jgi:hypothetical protein
MSLMSSEDDFGIRLELGGELLEQEEDTRVPAAERKRESEAIGECFEEQEGEVVS